MTHKVEQMILAATGFFWCFLLWFSTAAFSPSIRAEYSLDLTDMAILASSAIWMAPIGRIVAGWASDKFGARNTFVIILLYCGLFSIFSSFATDYKTLFILRVIVASAGVSFVVGVQHVSQWFEKEEIGVAMGLYAGTGNAGAGIGMFLLPRIYGTDYSSAFLHLGIIALIIAGIYFLRGVDAKDEETRLRVKSTANVRGTLFVWTRFAAIALMLGYGISFGLEIAMNAWLPSYYAVGFASNLEALGYTSIEQIQIAVGTFAAVQSFNASLFRPFSGYMSDLFQRRNWMPYPLITKKLPYSPRIHWLVTALLVITVSMILLTLAGLSGILPLSVVILAIFGIAISFGTGSTFAIVPLMFKDRPGTATGFIGGVSTAFGIVYPLIFGAKALANIHIGYALAAIVIFIPVILFVIWAMRYDESPEDHGIGSKEYWLGENTEV